jgi:hypothetical protein
MFLFALLGTLRNVNIFFFSRKRKTGKLYGRNKFYY